MEERDINEKINEAHLRFQVANQKLSLATTCVSTNLAISTTMRGVGEKALEAQVKAIIQMTKMTENYAAAVLSLGDKFGRQLREIQEEAENA